MPDSDSEEALRLLRRHGFRRFRFQADAAAEIIAAPQSGTNLVVEAPTGSGKTVITYLAIALLARRHPGLKVLVLIPSRPLLAQHQADAAWLRNEGGHPVHVLLPEDSWAMWSAVLRGPGTVLTTPWAFGNRLAGLQPSHLLRNLDLAVLDEIDMYFTREMERRTDIYAVVSQLLDAEVPVVGFTGTSLTDGQREIWTALDFDIRKPAVPKDWLPSTRVEFVSIHNTDVIREDLEIHDQLTGAYREFAELGGNPRSWKEIKEASRSPDRIGSVARRILSLHGQRLRLFEGENDTEGKLSAIAQLCLPKTPALVMSRYISSAQKATSHLRDNGIEAVHANGTMPRWLTDSRMNAFRDGEIEALVITRELGGRGLDFPVANTSVLVSPRSNYQAVAQELARMRSRRGSPKTAYVLYYESTSESVKAARLARHLVYDNRFGDDRLFEVVAKPIEAFSLDSNESRHLHHENLEEELQLYGAPHGESEEPESKVEG